MFGGFAIGRGICVAVSGWVGDFDFELLTPIFTAFGEVVGLMMRRGH